VELTADYILHGVCLMLDRVGNHRVLIFVRWNAVNLPNLLFLLHLNDVYAAVEENR